MVLKHQSIQRRLAELDTILTELNKYQHLDPAEIQRNLSQRWVLERGLIAATSLILDIADHILGAYFGLYADSYEESLTKLYEQQVISAHLYEQIKGVGGFRNILVHGYLQIQPVVVLKNYHKALQVFPQFAQEILAWLDKLD